MKKKMRFFSERKRGNKVLFIGRFQPFHKGHLGTIQEILKIQDVGELIIAIGSSNLSHTQYNPFTAEEREEMIRSALPASGKIIQIPDLPDDDEWTKVLLEKYFNGEVVYSGNSWVIELLTKAGKEVRIPPPIENPSGTKIRQLIAEGKKWEQFVSGPVVKVIRKISGEERIRALFL